MEFEAKEEYKKLCVDNCGFSTRTYNVLNGNGIHNVYCLICCYNEGITRLRNAGVTVENEITEFLLKLVSEPITRVEENNGERVDVILDEIEEIDAEFNEFLKRMEKIDAFSVPMTSRIHNGLQMTEIKTVRDFLELKEYEIKRIRNLGVASIQEILHLQNRILEKRDEFFENVHEIPDSEYKPGTRDFDKVTITKLREEYDFSTSLLCEWFDITRQRIYQKLDPKKKNKDRWTGKLFSETDESAIKHLISFKIYHASIEESKYYIFNNRNGDLVFLCVNDLEIKCFFYKDLPEGIQKELHDHRMDILAEDELQDYPLGEIIYILTEPYLKPYNMYKFRLYAQRRGMSLDEYALFIDDIPYYGGRNITDEQIIEFFNNNLIDGKVYISSDPSNQWVRRYASRGGYSIKEFVELYGYETTSVEGHDKSTIARNVHIEELSKHIVKDNVVYIDTFSAIYRTLSVYAQKRKIGVNEYIESLGFVRTMNRPSVKAISDEKDMMEYPISPDVKGIEKIFARYPLLGNYVFSDTTALNKNAKIYLDKLISDTGYFRSENILKAEMQIALAVINYAKSWASENESSFWNYIVGKFGYRDTGYEISGIIKRCVEDALTANKRWFLYDSNGREYKSTIVIHALSTKKSWMNLYDFLFDFYKNNLNWTYIENDPSIGQMVRALSAKINDEDTSNEITIPISMGSYQFQEGIRKLIYYRPLYAEKMFGRMIKRLDQIIRQEVSPAKLYEEVLADEWIEKKMQRILETRTTRTWTTEAKEVAISYDRIHPTYQLENGKEIKLVIPDIRLKEEDFGNVSLNIFYKDRLVDTQSLSHYGNELGRTIRGKKVALKDIQRVYNCESFEFSIKIYCGDVEIYDSGTTLYRNCLIFDKKNEINPSSCSKGGYTVVFPDENGISTENIERTTIEEDSKYGYFYFLRFEADYILSYKDRIIAMDNVANEAMRVIVPNVRKDLTYIKGSDRYKVALACDTIKIVLNESDLQGKYVVRFNQDRISFDTLGYTQNGDKIIYELPIANTVDDSIGCHVQIIDLNRNKLMLNEQFIVADGVKYEFNKPIYYSDLDYQLSCLNYSIYDSEPETILFTKEDDEIEFPYKDGNISIKIPKLVVRDTMEHQWGKDEKYWIDDIEYTSFMFVDLPESLDCRILLNDVVLNKESNGSYGIGNAVHSVNSIDKDTLFLTIQIISEGQLYKTYHVGKIVTKEKFEHLPSVKLEDNILSWDKGYRFYGKKDTSFSIRIKSENGYDKTYALDLNNSIISENVSMELGEYNFQILKESGNIFMPVSELIAEGTLWVGDENELRILNHIFVVDSVTFYDNYSGKVMQKDIGKICIDNLKYVGTETVSDDGELPIYTGTVFFINKHGERKEFADSNYTTESAQILKVNPVRIAIINENNGVAVLSMVDSEGDCFNDGDGFYCYSYLDKGTGEIRYSFTDHNYTDRNKTFYRGIDLYNFKREKEQ